MIQSASFVLRVVFSLTRVTMLVWALQNSIKPSAVPPCAQSHHQLRALHRGKNGAKSCIQIAVRVLSWYGCIFRSNSERLSLAVLSHLIERFGRPVVDGLLV